MKSAVPVILILVLIAYGVFAYRYWRRQLSQVARPLEEEEWPLEHRPIIGKSHFVLPPRRQPTPTTAISEKNESEAEKADIFAPEKQSHPRRIPQEKMDAVFDAPPAGESNEPDPEGVPFIEQAASDYEADMDQEMDREEAEEEESQPPAGRSLAKGVQFEQIGEAYRTVSREAEPTEEKKQRVGRTLVELEQTDMFEAIVSASTEGSGKVYELMDSYLKAYYRRIAERAAESPPPQITVPEDFDVQHYV